MYEILKTIAVAQSWAFTYARKDYANLYDELETGQTYIFLDPVDTVTEFGEYNEEERKVYSGSFLILVASDVDDEDYDTKYQDHIKPILDTTLATLYSAIRCNEVLQIESWRTIEVINLFDFNLDGVAVTYTVNEDA